MQMKQIFLSVVVPALILGGAWMYASGASSGGEAAQANNVTVVDGKQIVEITAKGGFLPRKSVAKAGLPTILRFDTNGTFDCSSSVRIPSLNITKTLPMTGVTDIDIGDPKVASLQGTCGMGMYPFEIDFQS
jgi:plastocyanin domain-containing protein